MTLGGGNSKASNNLTNDSMVMSPDCGNSVGKTVNGLGFGRTIIK